MIERRSLLGFIGVAIAAPVIVKATSLKIAPTTVLKTPVTRRFRSK